jgi:ornithine cyclodeaminase/alanine dehydrogenase-like protein (mu-crystallin family)
VFSRDAGRREAFARRVEDTLGIAAAAAPSVADAVRGAEVVTLVTRATAPFLTSAMVGRGTHVNAVGAITPERAEFEPTLLERCAVTAVDTLPQVQALLGVHGLLRGGRPRLVRRHAAVRGGGAGPDTPEGRRSNVVQSHGHGDL